MKVSEKQIIWARFWKKFLRLTRGRVAVLRALEVIIAEEPDSDLKEVIGSIHRDMEQGSTLSESMAKHPSEFSSSVLELIRTAERCGEWDEIVQEIADGLQDGTFD